MSDYRDSIHCRIDPEQLSRPDGGDPVQEISVIMTDDPQPGQPQGSLLAAAGDRHAHSPRRAPGRARAVPVGQGSGADRGGAMTVKPPAPPPLPAELEALLRRLRLPYVRRAAAEVLATANSQRWEHSDLIRWIGAQTDV
jgi:hypothetical protein